MGLFSKKETSYLGVDIGAGGIKLVELRSNKKRPQLWTYAIADGDLDIHRELSPAPVAEAATPERPIDPVEQAKTSLAAKGKDLSEKVDRYAAVLREAVEKSRATSKMAIASMPVSSVFHAVINLPKVPDKELQHHVEAKTTKMLPRPLEDMQLVYQVVPNGDKKNENIRLLVTAAPRDLVNFYTQVFTRAGLTLSELETEAFALERSLVGRDKATVMVVDMGAERTNFFIMDQGLPMTHRSIETGGRAIDQVLAAHIGVEPHQVSPMKADLSRAGKGQIDADLFRSVIDPIVKEIQYGFDMFLRQSGNEFRRPEKIILTGGSSVFPPVLEFIERSFDMRVFVGDPWARVVYQQGLSPLLHSIGPRMGTSIGLALKNIV